MKEGRMEECGPGFKVGDRVIISRPRSRSSFSDCIERLSSVTSVRTKSFEAGGLCFRYDGREWGGRNRIRLVTPSEDPEHIASLLKAEEAFQADRGNGLREDMILALLISSRDERDWLRLGVEELRRIAALHGIPSTRNSSRAVLTPEVLGVD
ncbi:MAG: hypothetical protein ABSF17_12945 [Terracidiphilus sp.]|jgi:hypothetical protein